MDALIKAMRKYWYLLLLLLLGAALILLPSRGTDSAGSDMTGQGSATQEEARLEAVLGDISGVGRVSVLYSENGVVVVCDGAESAAVRLSVVEAVSGYTGFGGGRIAVLRMETT